MKQRGLPFGDRADPAKATRTGARRPSRGARSVSPSAPPVGPQQRAKTPDLHPAPWEIPQIASRASPEPTRRRAFTVTELTDRIQGLLETEFVDVWVEGEISNLNLASSGHVYFSLKDQRAQLRAVIWKSARRLLRFEPRDGMKVIARGAVRLYAPRGEYSLNVELLEPLGKGALQQAFEELKERLTKEGLFDPARKRPLPALPQRIGVVTSPTGAVIRDILRVLSRRYRNLSVLVYPARVQGEGAADEIVKGIEVLNRLGGIDVLVVARGGGSLEDLWAFNEEKVARALAASRVPTISAIGHETDFTIADFVADLRAPTPSAAAEHVVQAKEELQARIAALEKQLQSALGLRMTRIRARVAALTSHRVFEAERGRIRSRLQGIRDLARRCGTALSRQLERTRSRIREAVSRLEAFRWDRLVAARRERVGRQLDRIEACFRADIEGRRAALGRLAAALESLSPVAVLSRGYALVWDVRRNRLVRVPREVEVGDPLRIRVHGGMLCASVTGKETT